MEEKEVKQEPTNVKNGLYVVGAAFLVGYILGGAAVSKQTKDYYNRGFKDAFDTILSKSR